MEKDGKQFLVSSARDRSFMGSSMIGHTCRPQSLVDFLNSGEIDKGDELNILLLKGNPIIEMLSMLKDSPEIIDKFPDTVILHKGKVVTHEIIVDAYDLLLKAGFEITEESLESKDSPSVFKREAISEVDYVDCHPLSDPTRFDINPIVDELKKRWNSLIDSELEKRVINIDQSESLRTYWVEIRVSIISRIILEHDGAIETEALDKMFLGYASGRINTHQCRNFQQCHMFTRF